MPQSLPRALLSCPWLACVLVSSPWLLGCRWGDWGGWQSAQLCALCESLHFLSEPGASASVGFKTDGSELNASGQKACEAACERHAVALSHRFGSLNRAPDKTIYYTWPVTFEGIYIWTRFWLWRYYKAALDQGRSPLSSGSSSECCMLLGKNCLYLACVNCPTFLLPCNVYTAKNSTGLLTITLQPSTYLIVGKPLAHVTRKIKVAIKRAFVRLVFLVIPLMEWAVILNVAGACVFILCHSRWQIHLVCILQSCISGQCIELLPF